MASQSRSPQFLSSLQRLNTRDPLKAITRRGRRTLLLTSFVGIGIAQTGLIPSKIEALGIAFERADQSALLLLLALAVAYLWISFVIYAWIDFVKLRGAYNAALLEHLSEEHGFYPRAQAPDDSPREKLLKSLERRIGFYMTSNRYAAVTRTIWEFFFPTAVGLYAIVVLFWTRAHRL